MKKFLLDSFLFFTLFYFFIFILYAVNIASERSLKAIMTDLLIYSFVPWMIAGPLAVLISVFRNKTGANKAYLIIIGIFWTLLLVLIPYLVIGAYSATTVFLSSPGWPRQHQLRIQFSAIGFESKITFQLRLFKKFAADLFEVLQGFRW